MTVRIVKSTFELKEGEQTIVIPCSRGLEFLAVKKETDKYKETGKCPICGADIYLEESGWTGHY